MPKPSPPSLEQLVARQLRRYEAHKPRSNQAPPVCVAISRLPGAGGAEIGLQVAEALGYGFFGIEIVDEIARERGVQRYLVQGLDERLRDAAARWLSDGFRDGRFRESDYLRGLMRTLATLSERGHAVILGRGSAHVLPPERTLRVLVVAPQEFRCARLAAARELDAEAARHELEIEETERLRFLQHHFGVDPDDPSLYDIVVNPQTLGMSGAAGLVLRAFGERFPAADVARPRAGSRPARIPVHEHDTA